MKPIIDPIDNFKIPEKWIKLSKIPRNELENKISSGCYLLLADGSLLKRGFTTGTTVSGAVKSSILSLKREVSEVSVTTPSGIKVVCKVSAKNGISYIKKYSGDHRNDVTSNIEIIAESERSNEIKIKTSEGIGTKNGVAAISSSAMKQIKNSIKEALIETELDGVHVNIYIPDGKRIAKKTLNQKLGIIDGISILGTTGFVEPWNEHLGDTKKEIIKNSNKLVLTTGRLGLKYSNILFPDYDVVLIGSDISNGLSAAKGEVIVCGLPGLILKWAYIDILKNTDYKMIQEIIDENPEHPILNIAFEKAINKSKARVVLLNRDGTIFRDSGEI